MPLCIKRARVLECTSACRCMLRYPQLVEHTTIGVWKRAQSSSKHSILRRTTNGTCTVTCYTSACVFLSGQPLDQKRRGNLLAPNLFRVSQARVQPRTPRESTSKSAIYLFVCHTYHNSLVENLVYADAINEKYNTRGYC